MRRLNPEERVLWERVVATVKPLHATAPATPADAASQPPAPTAARTAPPKPRPAIRHTRSGAPAAPGVTLDASWDKKLARGLVQPDAIVDLHGHNLATAYDLLDRRLERAVAGGARVLLLVTGRPPSDDRRPVGRGAIRAAIGDWLAASRHARDIAAVRNAHPRHGGAGALYIVLRRRRPDQADQI